jgi:hypothetical protein
LKILDSSLLEEARLNQRYLGLESTEKGFDSVQIRIWYDCINTPHFLVGLKNTNGKWKAELCRIIYPPTWQRSGDSISGKIIQGSPKSGWPKFISQLFNLKILTLPNDYEIPNFKYDAVTDGCGAEVEIATKNTYRFYAYNNPELYKYWQTKNILLILKLINEEFEIKTKFKPKHLWPNDDWE